MCNVRTSFSNWNFFFPENLNVSNGSRLKSIKHYFVTSMIHLDAEFYNFFNIYNFLYAIKIATIGAAMSNHFGKELNW